MKVKYIDIENGHLLLKCDMDVIPKEGDKMIIKDQGGMIVTKVWWWIESPSNKYARIYVKQTDTLSKLKKIKE